jgi:hypothetical protein
VLSHARLLSYSEKLQETACRISLLEHGCRASSREVIRLKSLLHVQAFSFTSAAGRRFDWIRVFHRTSPQGKEIAFEWRGFQREKQIRQIGRAARQTCHTWLMTKDQGESLTMRYYIKSPPAAAANIYHFSSFRCHYHVANKYCQGQCTMFNLLPRQRPGPRWRGCLQRSFHLDQAFFRLIFSALRLCWQWLAKFALWCWCVEETERPKNHRSSS